MWDEVVVKGQVTESYKWWFSFKVTVNNKHGPSGFSFNITIISMYDYVDDDIASIAIL